MTFEPSSKADLLELWRRIFPRSYTVPIEDEGNGQGLDVYAQQAAIFERVGEAIAISTQAAYLRAHSTQVRPQAFGERRATGTVQIRRTAPATGAITLIAGTELVARAQNPNGDLVDGPVYRLTADVTIAAGSLGPVAGAIECTRPGYQGNLPAGRITAFVTRGQALISGTVEAGNVLRDDGTPDRWARSMEGQYARITGGPNAGAVPRRVLAVTQGSPTSFATVDGTALVVGAFVAEVEEFAELGLVVEQVVPTSGGRHGWLDAIGRDRNVARQRNEDDEQYRLRIGALDDVVSPAAILRAAARILTPLGIGYHLLETREGLRGFVLDEDPLDVGQVCSDTGAPHGGLVLLDATEAVRFFVLCVDLSSLGEFGGHMDPPGGAETAVDEMFMDGFPVGYYAALGAVFDAIDRARAAGVRWALVRGDT